MSQEELAQKLGVSRQAIIALEQGSSLPSLPVLMAIMRVLDIPFTRLFDEEWNPFRAIDDTPETDQTRLAFFRNKDAPRSIPVSLVETATNLVVTAELSGIKEEDVTVDLSTQHILIIATRKPSARSKTCQVHIDEVEYGPLMRILSLPSPIDTNEARAEFSHGLLELTLPKFIPQSKRRITFSKNAPIVSTKEEHGSQ